jgi:hypothetical protein
MQDDSQQHAEQEKRYPQQEEREKAQGVHHSEQGQPTELG